MLHLIRADHVDTDKSLEVTPMDQGNGHIVTLHFEFGENPSEQDVTTLGQNFNEIFERGTLGAHRIRWGGMRRTIFSLATRKLRGSLRRRRASGKGKIVAHMNHMTARSSSAIATQCAGVS